MTDADCKDAYAWVAEGDVLRQPNCVNVEERGQGLVYGSCAAWGP